MKLEEHSPKHSDLLENIHIPWTYFSMSHYIYKTFIFGVIGFQRFIEIWTLLSKLGPFLTEAHSDFTLSINKQKYKGFPVFRSIHPPSTLISFSFPVEEMHPHRTFLLKTWLLFSKKILRPRVSFRNNFKEIVIISGSLRFFLNFYLGKIKATKHLRLNEGLNSSPWDVKILDYCFWTWPI